MSLDELNQRIKEEVVLREGDLFDWQWRQVGLVAEAEALGVPESEFLGLVNEVSRAINPYFGRISDLKIKVGDLARLGRKKLTAAQIDQIVSDAARLQLPPDFVRDRWIPAILATIPEPPEVANEAASAAPALQPIPVGEPVKSQPEPVRVTQPTPVNNALPPAVPTNGVDRVAVSRKVHQFLDEYVADKHIPVRVLKPLFLATNFDETLLADAVLTYLSANYYAAETPVQGQTLSDKLLSTDWRHLSWWEPKPIVPSAPVGATQPVRPAQRSSSDTSVIGMAVVAVGLLIGAVWWVTTGKTDRTPAKKTVTIQPSDTVPTTRLKKKPRRNVRSAQQTRTAQP